VKGLLRIRANVRGARTTGIGLYVDGRVISRDRVAPFTLRWNSKRVHDGRHRLTLAAVARDGRIAKRTLPIVVANRVRPKKAAPTVKPLPKVRLVSQNLASGATVSGAVTWHAHTIGPVARVQFVVDGSVLATLTSEPWTTTWDSATAAPGTHVLNVRALTKDGRTGATSTVSVTVAAPAPPPAPVSP
jgi:hypothetical protein